MIERAVPSVERRGGDRLAPLYSSPLRVHQARDTPSRHASSALIHVGIGDANGDAVEPAAFDVLLTETPRASAPWTSVTNIRAAVSQLALQVEKNPKAAATFAQVLHTTEALSFEDALLFESYAYSTLLGGAEFRAWRRAHAPRSACDDVATVRCERTGADVSLTLSRQHRRNALNADLRSALVEQLGNVRDDPSVGSMTLRGDGAAFCSGGDLDEFGTQNDLAAAHFIRMLQAPALIITRCSAQTIAHVQGACIGAGLEIAAACDRVIAEADAVFSLPEIGMGLMPGAGGTVTVPRRIGRHRACYLGLSGATLGASAALSLGLVDKLVEGASLSP